MKSYNRNFILILILLGIFLFVGCNNIKLKVFKDPNASNAITESKKDISKDDKSDNDSLDDVDDTDIDDNQESKDNDKPSPTIIQPIKNVELLIYVVNSTMDLDTITALVPADSEITPQLILDTVVNSMADQSLFIGVESVTTQDDTVIISFYADKPPLTDVGSGLEHQILDAIAQSLTENLDDYNKIIYRVEGGPYISGHIELGIDEIYFED